MTDTLQLLIVEDDHRLAGMIKRYLMRYEFNVRSVDNGKSAIQCCHESPPDIVILDLMLPDMDGISVCRRLRGFYSGPVLMLTASGNDIDQVMGLEVGADDYVVKPIEPRVLLARVRALRRRSEAAVSPGTYPEGWQFGGLVIDNQSKSVTLHERPIRLTTKEFELLALLAKNAGKVLSRDDIYTCLRGIDYDGTDRAVDVKISRLRRKLGDDAATPNGIKTIWGKGYLFVPAAWGG